MTGVCGFRHSWFVFFAFHAAEYRIKCLTCQSLTLLYFVFLPRFPDWLKLIASSVIEDSCDTVSLEYSIVISIKALFHLWSYLFVKLTVCERFESGEGHKTSPAAHWRQQLQNDVCVQSLKQHKILKTTPAKVAGFFAGFGESRLADNTCVFASCVVMVT